MLTLIYLVFTFYLFSASISVHQFFRDKGIHLELGHADEVLVEFFLLWTFLALVNVVAVFLRRHLVGNKDAI